MRARSRRLGVPFGAVVGFALFWFPMPAQSDDNAPASGLAATRDYCESLQEFFDTWVEYAMWWLRNAGDIEHALANIAEAKSVMREWEEAGCDDIFGNIAARLWRVEEPDDLDGFIRRVADQVTATIAEENAPPAPGSGGAPGGGGGGGIVGGSNPAPPQGPAAGSSGGTVID